MYEDASQVLQLLVNSHSSSSWPMDSAACISNRIESRYPGI